MKVRKRYQCTVYLLLFTLSGFSQIVDYAFGDNHDIDFGINLGSSFQLNPRASGGQNQLSLGLNADLNYTYFEYKKLFETRLIYDFSIQRQDKERIKKNTDYLAFNAKYGFKNSYASKFYFSSDFSFNTNILPAYDGNFIQADSDSTLIASLFSPTYGGISLGMEYRPKDAPNYLYFSPASLNILWVPNDFLALQRKAYDSEGEYLGPLLGNEEGSNWKNRFGAQVKYRYSTTLGNDRFFWDTSGDLFLAYQEFTQNSTFNPIQVSIMNKLSLKIVKGLNLAINTRVLYDPDLLFVDSKSASGSLSKDASYNIANSLVLSYRISSTQND